MTFFFSMACFLIIGYPKLFLDDMNDDFMKEPIINNLDII